MTAEVNGAAGVTGPRTHAAIVLAAGGSRRLGRAKQGLRVQGQSLLGHAVDQVLATAPCRLVVVLGADAESLRKLLPDGVVPELQVVANPDWQEGLASSLRRAAGALADWTGPSLIVACDQPLLEARHLQALLASFAQHPEGDHATRYHDGVGIPVLVHAQTLAQAVHLRGDRGLKGLLRKPLRTIDADELGFDIDTPEDLTTAIARGWIDADD